MLYNPSYEETEGIVVLEALASHQHTRSCKDIPVYNGCDRRLLVLPLNVDEFVDSLNKVLNGQVTDNGEAGYKVAESFDRLGGLSVVEAYPNSSGSVGYLV